MTFDQKLQLKSVVDSTKLEHYISDEMTWAVPKYLRNEVDTAGLILIDPQASPLDWMYALDVVNNWRSSHYFPLNTLQIGLRNKARSIDPHSLIAQRIKRRLSIEQKLRRFRRLSLSEIQDIGGCRAVVSSAVRVKEIVSLYETSWHRHELISWNNYIDAPKRSGYRSYHLIYRYKSDRSQSYNDLKIEIQLRSRLQHAWATAVETVGTFTRQALKSSMGDKLWLRFFSLMGTAIAIREKTVPVPRTPTDRKELKNELQKLVSNLGVIEKLQTYSVVPSIPKKLWTSNARFGLVILNVQTAQIQFKSYTFAELEQAFADYSKVEERVAREPGLDAVLVSAESLTQLKRSYPNYFLDTRVFLDVVKEAISDLPKHNKS